MLPCQQGPPRETLASSVPVDPGTTPLAIHWVPLVSKATRPISEHDCLGFNFKMYGLTILL